MENVIPYPFTPYWSARYGFPKKKKKQKNKKKKTASLPVILQPIPSQASSSFMDELLPVINSHNEVLTQKKIDLLQEENGQQKEDQKNCSCSGSTSTLELPLPTRSDECTYGSTASEDSTCSICACPTIVRSQSTVRLPFQAGSTKHLLLSFSGHHPAVGDHFFPDSELQQHSLFITEAGTIDNSSISLSMSQDQADVKELRLTVQWFSFIAPNPGAKILYVKKGESQSHVLRVPSLPNTWENTTKCDVFRPLSVERFEQLALHIELTSEPTVSVPFTIEMQLSLVFSLNTN